MTENPMVKFLQVNKQHRACVDAEISKLGYGLHCSQHRMLRFLCENGGDISQKEIAAHFKVSAAAIAVTLKTLEKEGYIRRAADEVDTRKNLVDITEKGKEVIEKTKGVYSSVDTKMIEGISSDEMDVFAHCLDVMAANLEKMVEKED
jgi:DNA-binding MarR family transcriptional regulator